MGKPVNEVPLADVKPCPFCSCTTATARRVVRPDVVNTLTAVGMFTWAVVCDSCGASGPSSAPGSHDAVRAWERRVVVING